MAPCLKLKKQWRATCKWPKVVPVPTNLWHCSCPSTVKDFATLVEVLRWLVGLERSRNVSSSLIVLIRGRIARRKEVQVVELNVVPKVAVDHRKQLDCVVVQLKAQAVHHTRELPPGDMAAADRVKILE